VIGIVVHIVQR